MLSKCITTAFVVFFVLNNVLDVNAVLSYSDVIKEEFETFKTTHNKRYDDENEENFRLKVR